MLKIGIIAAMEQEIRVLTEQLNHKEEITKANQKFYKGKLSDMNVVLVQSGIGKVNASIAATLLIEVFQVDAVINTGSAGGIGAGLSVGDLVLSKQLAYNDADARAFGYAYGQIPQMPERYGADDKLISLFMKAAEKEWTIRNGLIVTGDSFISSKVEIKKIKEYFEDALVTEMEGAAIAQTCYQFDIPFLVIRAVSDVADEEASVSFDEFIELAGKKSAETVINFLKEIKQEQKH
ncbi:5'-methylthioadenosine/adenosylhomocysteine nucleosidase [Alkalibacterium iburiense]|uniref:5'-methylthioadenosine/S-adenosylhomocysteine nucleosidase n=1 Tax=Alkalibacterium iburiense TaxID=290589 RepID=A0ABN0XCX1_9LACT